MVWRFSIHMNPESNNRHFWFSFHVSFFFTLAAPIFLLDQQAREEPRLVRNAFGERIHDAGLVASRKPKFRRPFGGRYSEEKGRGSETDGHGARTGKRPRTGPTIREERALFEGREKERKENSTTVYIYIYCTIDRSGRIFLWGCCCVIVNVEKREV